ncbi:MAG TPA: hypothetical protein VHD83_14910 [Puia sp.]|nr:hypothetical protein [Puia sp.]
MKKSFILLLLACGLTGGVHAQFMHSLGGTVDVMWANLGPEGYQDKVTFVFRDFTYFPRYNVMENGNSSISIGVPLGLGFGSVSNFSDGSSSLYFGVDAPLVADYNFGWKSTADNDSRVGGYLGGGFGYRYTSFSYNDPYYGSSGFHANSYGPLVRGGVRFSLGASDMGLTLGLFYKAGLEREKYKTIGINVLMDF